jgi:hypothetical protein
VDDDLVLDVRMSPRDALARVDAAINRPPRRVFGILKVEAEYVGIVRTGEFEIWERRQHAVRAHGRIERHRQGARVTANFAMGRRSRGLVIAFFGVYAILVLGFLSQSTQPIDAVSAAVLVLGAVAIAAFFLVSARRQRAALRRFVSMLFVDVAGPQRSEP